ncbi:MAG: hypothetical protein ACRDUY_08300, partial [Nitriliruptorales bacterium]
SIPAHLPHREASRVGSPIRQRLLDRRDAAHRRRPFASANAATVNARSTSTTTTTPPWSPLSRNVT